MTDDNATAPRDPYAGARAMGVPVPPPADPQADAEAPQTSGDDSADYAAYLKWKARQDGTEAESTPTDAAPKVTVTPAAKFTATDTQTPMGSYLGADVTTAADTIEAVAPGLVSRLKSVLADHQSLVSELEELVSEAEKF